MTAELTLKDQFLNSFEKREDAFLTHRNAAHKVLEDLTFPTRKTEAWKYTPLNDLLKQSFSTTASAELIDIKPFLIPGLDAKLLVFINGIFNESLSDEIISDTITATSIKKADKEKRFNTIADNQTIFTAINTAYFTDGAYIKLSDKTIAEKPIHIIHIATESNASIQNRNLIFAGKHSELEVIETFISTRSGAFINSFSEIFVNENAKLKQEKIQNSDVYLINRAAVYQEKNSKYSINTITLKGSLVRNDITVLVDGENCETILNGLYLPHDKEHVDNHTVVDHLKPHCESKELYKGIIDDKATAVFNGKVFVRQDAQKINAFQSNANILLSDDANVNTKPELEIYADDVKCSHGSTTGQLDEESIFYLRSRGLSEKSAVQMLLHAFTDEVIEKIENEALKQYVEILVNTKLKGIK